MLDLGCAFGFGTRLLSKRYHAYGHDLSSVYIERAQRKTKGAIFTAGEASQVPYPDCFFDGVVLLDVLEHVPDDRAVANEIGRVLRAGGRLVVSVPHRGLLAPWDSLNVYAHLAGSDAPPPTDDPSWSRSPCHRHYSLDELRAVFGPDFSLEKVRYTGAGIAEPVNLVLLLLLRGLVHWPALYERLQYLYFGVYLLEDLLPTGPWGYHMMTVWRRCAGE